MIKEQPDNASIGVPLGNQSSQWFVLLYLNKIDYYIKELNIDIEFNGDIFHANPKIFKTDDRPNPWAKQYTAQQIWKGEAKRIDLLEKTLGTKTIVVWESDYRNGIDIVDFIKNTLKIEI